MSSLLTPIAALPRMRPEIAKKFLALGLTTLQDALWHFPIRHQDWRQRLAIAQLQSGQPATVLATILSIRGRRAWRRRGIHVTEAVVTDESGARLRVVWFNQPYLATWIKPKQAWFLSGKISAKNEQLQMQNPMYERPGASPTHETLVPVYPSTAGLSQWQIRKVIKRAVEYAALLPDPLDHAIQVKNSIVDRTTALKEIHFPTDEASATRAVNRMKFEELLTWQLRWRLAESEREALPGIPMPFQSEAIREFIQRLPFKLTDDQRLAAWEMFQDMGKPRAMSRLLQGDVGTGKTVVAALAALLAMRQGWQVAWLAPTVVLAQQHATTLKRFFAGTDFSIHVLAGHQRDSVASQPAIIVGTHALFTAQLDWSRLGLVVIDEQQRFGVAQRQVLLDRPQAAGLPVPHFLSLTATPIPRTLALFLSGELAISSLHSRPPGRQPIVTRLLGSNDRDLADEAIQETCDRGLQVYVITPLIEESDVFGATAATTEHARLVKKFPKLHVGLVHGLCTPEERVQALQDFREHRYDILVSTTVIEVGVDVPNASLIVILDAERFGLAQLHQLRGRVGRGDQASQCLLVTEKNSAAVRQRLQRVAETNDGLALAELDLSLRGAGDLYGLRQSGLPDWKLATLQDQELMTRARQTAESLDSANRQRLLTALSGETQVNVHRE